MDVKKVHRTNGTRDESLKWTVLSTRAVLLDRASFRAYIPVSETKSYYATLLNVQPIVHVFRRPPNNVGLRTWACAYHLIISENLWGLFEHQM